MADDQLSWDKIFDDGAQKTPVAETAKAKSKAAEPAAAKPRAKTPPPAKIPDGIPLSELDWAPLGEPPPPDPREGQTRAPAAFAPARVGKAALVPAPAEGKIAPLKSEPARVAPSRTKPAQNKPPAVDALQALFCPPAAGLAATSAARDRFASGGDGGAEADDGALDAPAREPQVYSVHELNKQIRSILEGKFPLVWVKGEISNFKAHTSGHFYFSLKDAKAQVSAVMFRGFNQQLKFRPEDGMEVIVRGRVTVYEPRGNYQMFCEMMEPVGAGALQKAFEQLKAKLQGEGLFDPARKRPLPSLPKHIAIVTSPTGAAIRDMLNVLGRRFKGLRITLVPTKVQGEQAAGEIVAAIELADRIRDVDVMIVGRGGGSIEDMWCFNDERVARAIAAARAPVISAVGHEIDFTIADFVADLRAPTPSAAAELVVKNAGDLRNRIETLARSLRLAAARGTEFRRQAADALAKRLVDPQRRVQDCMLRSDELAQRLEGALRRGFAQRRMGVALSREKLGTPVARLRSERQRIGAFAQRLATGARTLRANKAQAVAKQMALLDSLSPLRVVERGYSVVTLENQVVNSVDQVSAGAVVCIQFAHGRASAEIREIENRKGVKDRE